MGKLLINVAFFTAALACMDAAALVDTHWRLIEVGGKPAEVEGEARQPHIRLLAQDARVEGFGGCNGFGGTYKLEGEHLRFQDIVATLRACADEAMNERERALMDALSATTRYKVSGKRLELSDGEKTLARFEAAE
ncbi:MAG: META domain-containing protein [Bryobacteraceae bacterium]|nr:META domain-containing protein [Bryobacteraceae bacterium]